MNFWTEVLEFSEKTAARIGQQLLADFGRVQAAEKDDGSLITQSDRWADREIRNAIATAFPDHGILSEEGQHTFPDVEWCWVIDPLDGTTNFARGIPIWAISIALFYRGTPVFGYVHLPPLGQSFYGFLPPKFSEIKQTKADIFSECQPGAFLNHRPIQTSQESAGSNQFFSFCSRSIPAITYPFPAKIRMLGVASYNFLCVAAGWTLGGVEATPKIWDIGAVWVIVQAAGGVWVSLEESTAIFPLTVGENYRDRAYPSLVVAHSALVEVFQPLLERLSR